MAHLPFCRSASYRNGAAHLGLHLQRGLQGKIGFTKKKQRTHQNLPITPQILFRVSLTLLMGRRRQIEDTEDIISLANLLQEMIHAPEVSDCHTFMESIFKVPGSLKRIELERMRMAAAKVIHNR